MLCFPKGSWITAPSEKKLDVERLLLLCIHHTA
jgi:hypothetical protein